MIKEITNKININNSNNKLNNNRYINNNKNSNNSKNNNNSKINKRNKRNKNDNNDNKIKKNKIVNLNFKSNLKLNQNTNLNSNLKFNQIIIFSLILSIIDIISKYFFTNKRINLITPISINYSKNFGSALSIFSNIKYYNLFIIIISIIILTLLIIILYSYFNSKLINKYPKIFSLKKINLIINSKKPKYSLIANSLFIAGIIGNLYDRIIFGYVRDFIKIKYLFTFNLADTYLFLGVIIYIIIELKINNKNKL